MIRKAQPQALVPAGRKVTIPGPVGGWNARDPLAEMNPLDAVFLDNFFPRAGSVDVRPGSALFATLPADTALSPHNVQSIMSYSPPSGTKKLFAGADDGVYNVTAGGAIGSAATAGTNGKWQSTNVSTAGGAFLWMCNGVDKSRYFDGTNWVVLDGASTPSLTGVTSTTVTNVSLFKFRLILCVANSLSFWYLPLSSVAGLAAEFPLATIFRKGGYLVATETWTLDGGNGPANYFAAITSEGEMAIYTGTDPSSASTFALVGVYTVGRPVSNRCFVRLGGDLGVLTVQGLVPLSKALQSVTVDRSIAISDKISKAWTDYTANYGTLFGWQPILFPEATMLLVNVPVTSDHTHNNVYSYQFVMNTQTKAWARFTGMPAEAWGTHDGGLYFGLHNKVYKAWTGGSDSGFPIDAKGKQAFRYIHRGASSFVTLMRPIVSASASVALQIGVDTDYQEMDLGSISISYGQSVAQWDVAKWDQAAWSAGSSVNTSWKSVQTIPGSAIAPRLRAVVKDVTMSWIATDIIVQRGGML